jgi:hypothetical protein
MISSLLWSPTINPFREEIFAGLQKDQSMTKNHFPFHVSRFPLAVLAAFLICPASPATTFTESFAADPSQNGWKIFGDTNLFQWDSTNHDLAVTWDSSQTNTYLYHSLGTILAIDDAFSVEFDLNLADAQTGAYGSQLAVGFLNISNATSPAFLRTLGTSPNVAEFDYFPPSQISASVDATLIDASNNFYFNYNTVPLNPGILYHIRVAHDSGAPGLSGEVFTNGILYASLTNTFPSAITDIRLDTIAISSYQDDGFGDTVLAHGTVANFVVTTPPPPIQNLTGSFSNAIWRVQFADRTNWLFTLERSTNLFSWTNASSTTSGVDNILMLQDTNAPADKAYYRVRAQRP